METELKIKIKTVDGTNVKLTDEIIREFLKFEIKLNTKYGARARIHLYE